MMKLRSFVCVLVFALALLVAAGNGFAGEKLDLNSASVEQLIELKGVGEVLAQRIVEYRQAHGQFKSVEELVLIKGVGEKKLEKLMPYLTVSEG